MEANGRPKRFSPRLFILFCSSIYLTDLLKQFGDTTKSGGRLLVVTVLKDHVDYFRIAGADGLVQDWQKETQS